jgi:peptidyl-prolyl cis-trans isomerase C
MSRIAAMFCMIVLLTAWCFAADTAAGNKPATDPKTVVATVGDYKITEGMIDNEINDMPAQIAYRYSTPDGRKMLLDQMIIERVLLNEAKASKLEKDAKMERQIVRAGNQILVSQYYRDYISNQLNITDEQAKAYYQQHPDLFSTKPQAKLHHISFKSEEEALAARVRIESGQSSFAKEAENSTDTGTAKSTGLLGYVSRDVSVTALGKPDTWSDAVFTLKPGEVSPAIKTDTGWHLFLVDEQRPAEILPYDQVRMQVREKMLVTDEDIASYYNTNKEKYAIPPGVHLAIILSDTEAEAARIKGLIEKGLKFGEAAQKYSTDRATRDKVGDIGWVRAGQYITTIGRDPDFEKVALAMKPNDIAGPVKVEKGYVIIKCSERRDEGYRTLEEMHETISSQLFSEKSRKIVQDIVEGLKQKNKVKYLGEIESAKDLLDKAESAPTSMDKVKYYERFLSLYPNDPNAHKALFMIGFIAAEELKDYDKAKDSFHRLINTYPNSEFVNSAKWMLDNMGKEDAGVPPMPEEGTDGNK